ncbi:MAG: L,D-transpeptidase family protein [Sediminimonas sp.]|uniref:L,D-transpeptidase family protein n=1 Tax=Sediminimonas sp. TaxID=2823379 RepID=UPI002870AACF|nr:L,D-transpeptidase family protein [Sediminimonas sp.]MDR9485625.1 L,D-transpeptidase family protein [Sediminimonas sp.]
MSTPRFGFGHVLWCVAAAFCALLVLGASPAVAQVTAFKQAVAEAAAADRDIAAFYRDRGYSPIWTGSEAEDKARRKALFAALDNAPVHGLPRYGAYNAEELKRAMKAARTIRDMGQVEVKLSKAFLAYARDVQTGVIVPSSADSGIVRQVPYRDRLSYLVNFAKSDPHGFMKALPPTSREYTRLMKEKMRLQTVVERGGWGPSVPGRTLEPGAQGDAVVKLRNRLVAMGYMGRSATRAYDAQMQRAVQQFQVDHGLETDGVAGSSTISALNVPATERLKSVIVAMERERWLNRDLGKRHIKVNLTDFTAKIVDDGKVTFRTRSVVGATSTDRRSPEFSDVMEHMIINPTWHVPRSIAVNEYLPQMQRNPNAASHLRLVDGSGRVVPRSAVDFTQYTRNTFPFDIKQPPSNSNALGLVKFMFPNRHNIYLHDTPSKHLFAREKRAFSHGCIRLQDPFDFAYALLARQTDDPKGLFHSILSTGRETKVDLEQNVPVHLMYRTAVTSAKGRTGYREDIYGRDARIWNALQAAGVALQAVRG